jgi:hypothetical protein
VLRPEQNLVVRCGLRTALRTFLFLKNGENHMIKIAVTSLSFLALFVSIFAAFYWWRATQIFTEVGASIDDRPDLHIMMLKMEVYLGSQMNARAAILTGVASVLATMASALGVVS